MGLFTAILGLPLAPVRGVIALGQVIQEQVDQQVRSPAALRRDLEAVDAAAAKGEMSPEEHRAAQAAVLERATGPTVGGGDRDDSGARSTEGVSDP
ncbi:gas vesicle protein GvpG [Rhodococcus triatomae]|nr:gas vesicle protein gvpg [Rhodococcus triatomae BKS 15-14]